MKRVKDFLAKFDLNHMKKVQLLNDFNNMDETLFLERLRNLTHVLDLGIISGKKNNKMRDKILELVKLFKQRKLNDDGTLKWVKEVLKKYDSYKIMKQVKKKTTNIKLLIKNRRSVRSWSSKKISRKLVDELISYGMLSPVSCNRQSWAFTVFEKNKKLLNHSILEKAPVVIVIFIDTRPYFENEEFAPALDAGYCAENITLVAESKGLSTCSVYYANKPKEFSDKCGLESFYKPFIAVGIGYSDNTPTKVIRKKPKIIYS